MERPRWKIRNLRVVSIIEAVSYLLLLVATVIKQAGGTEVGVSVLGPIHGVLYLVFAVLVVVAKEPLEWDWVRTFFALVIGSLPFGGFWLEKQWLAPAEKALA